MNYLSIEVLVMRMIKAGVLAFAVVVCGSRSNAGTPDEWIALGARVHGAFGAFIPVGIKIGLDAVKRLNAKPRELTVLYHDSDASPCACFADGIAIATYASVGQRTLTISRESTRGRCRSYCYSAAPRWLGVQVRHPDSSSREAWTDEQRPGPARSVRCRNGGRRII